MSDERPDGPDQDEPLPFGMLWAIKRSFVSYVVRMPGGRAGVGNGARAVERDLLLFPAVEHSATDAGSEEVAGDGVRTWAFQGEVQYQGHMGMLFVRIASPLLTVRGDRAEMTIEDPYGEGDPIPLVTLTLQPGPARGDAQIWLGTDVRLTAAGAPIFNDVYQPGEPFEDLSLVLPAGS